MLLDRSFVKGYFRNALGLQNLGNLEGALDSVKRGLGVEPGNADLKKMSREIEEAMRQRKVDAAISAAEQQMRDNDIPAAFKTIDNAMRLDPTNNTLKNMMDRVRPKWEALEKQRVSGLSRTERLKEEGDTKYKNADFEGAIASYTNCLDAISDKSSDLALKVFSNRAACYKQLSNFDGTIADCTHVLEYKPDDVKVCDVFCLLSFSYEYRR